jgi:Dr1-associated corepressor
VKTKFPTARIKRIMQADEEVGKVAQQTPIAVGKALEMFMVNLVTKSADVAREKNSKRVSAQMLKQVVESDDQWDFLRDIVSKVESEEKASAGGAGAAAAGKGRARAETESEEEVIPEKKKRAGRKKRAA